MDAVELTSVLSDKERDLIGRIVEALVGLKGLDLSEEEVVTLEALLRKMPWADPYKLDG